MIQTAAVPLFTRLYYREKTRQLIDAREKFKELITDAIQQYRARCENTEENILLASLLSAQYVEEEKPGNKSRQLSDAELIDEMVTITVAGHETTSHTLSFFLYHMAVNEDYQEQCRMEITEAFDSTNSTYVDSKVLSEKLPFLSRCLKESMRLSPAVPFTTRYIHEDTPCVDPVTGNNILLTEGTTLIWNLAGINRNSRWWEKPDTFYPSHFEEEACRKRHIYANAAFGAGPKACIGNRFAIQEMKVIASYLLYHFRFRTVPGYELVEEWNITASPLHGVPLLIEKVHHSDSGINTLI